MITSIKSKLLRGVIIALSTTLIVNAGFYAGLFDELELKTFDIRAGYFSKKREPPPDIAVILIDEVSLRAMNPVVGRWPWPRSIHADVIDYLAMGGAKAIVFDILFTENERGIGFRPGSLGESDQRLVEATSSAGNVYHSAQLLAESMDEFNSAFLEKPLPKDFEKQFSVNAKGLFAGENNVYYIPFHELYRASKGIGIVEFSPDSDGVYRRTRLFRHYQGVFYPVLSIAPLMDVIKSDYAAIPLQKDSSYLINMYGDFKPYSMSGILTSIQKIKQGELKDLPVNPDEFNNKVVFIGGSAVGVEDLKATSIDNKTPGVFLHASIYGNIRNSDFLKYPPPFTTPLIVTILSFAATFGILWMWRLIYQIGLPVFFVTGYLLISFTLFKNNIVVDIIAPSATVIISWMSTFAYLSFTEGKDRKKVRRMLEQYVSPTVLTSVIDKTASDVLRAEVGSKERLTILFADIRGFTGISESLDAEKVVKLLNEYLSDMADVIFKYEGTLDKFIGDAIMAFWGAPLRVKDHSRRAVDSAIEMVNRVNGFNERMMAEGFPRIQIGVGIHTGDVILGNIGSERKLDYTIIGDNVNIASRMEGLTKQYGCSVLISEATYQEVKDSVPCRIVDMVRMKGKMHPVKIYEPHPHLNPLPEGEETSLPDTELGRVRVGMGSFLGDITGLSEKGFEFYLMRDWVKAIECYSIILEKIPDDTISRLFISRCKGYIQNEPSADWDGVYQMTQK